MLTSPEVQEVRAARARITNDPAKPSAQLTVEDVRTVRAAFMAAKDVDELLAAGVAEALAYCGFARGVVVAVDNRVLSAASARAGDDPASDELRRRLLAAPVPLLPGTVESDVVHLRKVRRPTLASVSPLRDHLALNEFALAPVIADCSVIALLLVDRPEGLVTGHEEESLEVIAQLLGLATESAVLRSRLTEVRSELRHLTVSVSALTNELVEVPIGLPSRLGRDALFVVPKAVQPSPDAVGELLTEREQDVAALVAEGLSNREIGEALFLSPDTAKMHVAALARKLNAANRAQIAARWTTLQASAA